MTPTGSKAHCYVTLRGRILCVTLAWNTRWGEEICERTPNLLNYVQHIFAGGGILRVASPSLLPLGYRPVSWCKRWLLRPAWWYRNRFSTDLFRRFFSTDSLCRKRRYVKRRAIRPVGFGRCLMCLTELSRQWSFLWA